MHDGDLAKWNGASVGQGSTAVDTRERWPVPIRLGHNARPGNNYVHTDRTARAGYIHEH